MVKVEDVVAAAERIKAVAHRTPVMGSRSIDAEAGCRIYFKCENLQRGGAFKIRGAANAVFSLTDEEARRGVATHSSGNHAAAVALAARERGVEAYVVLPTNVPGPKREAAVRYGAKVIDCEPSMRGREETIKKVLAETGANFVHPYDDDRVIAGQGTAMLEMVEEVPSLQVVVGQVSGGGLLSGTAIVAGARGIEVWGAEPAGADDARRSMEGGVLVGNEKVETIADGLRAQLSERTFGILRERLKGVLVVSDEEIVSAMRMVWERLKVVVEPSGVVGLAGVLANRELFRGREVGVILSGGNVDLGRLPWKSEDRS